MAESLVVNDQIVIPASELDYSFARSSGPGGQNVNKVNTKARLRWAVVASPSLPSPVKDRFRRRFATRINEAGELVLASDQHREQGRNARDCLEKLRAMILSVATPPPKRRRTRPSRSAIEARLEAKRRQSQRKRDRRSPPLDS